MKKSIFFLLTVLFLGAFGLLPKMSRAQSADQLPAFGMTLSNGQYFKAADIPKGKPVVLIYFAPDCDHCHTLMNAFFKQANAFKKAQVVMVTFKPVSDLTAFEQSYQIYQYPFIKVGSEETTFYLQRFYKIQTTPFTALYDKNGKLIVSYRKETPLNDLQKKLAQL